MSETHRHSAILILWTTPGDGDNQETKRIETHRALTRVVAQPEERRKCKLQGALKCDGGSQNREKTRGGRKGWYS
eukprot:scaffold93395_cov40-Tisochrysis_lutea.AAC.3